MDCSWQGCTVEVRECLDGSVLVLHRSVIVARQEPLPAPFTLVNREDSRARQRCPGNFTAVPPVPAAPPKRVIPSKPQGLTHKVRKPSPGHVWRKGHKPSATATP